MADTGYRFQQPGTGQFYHQQYNQQNHHRQHLARNGSPVSGGRGTYANDTPSPSRSPVSQAGSHNPYAMYNQNHSQGQNIMMNGAPQQRYMQMGMGQKYQHQSHNQHHNHQNHHQQQNHVGAHAGIGHQHTFSSGTMSNATPHFASSNLHNGNSTTNHISHEHNPNYQQQVQLILESRNAYGSSHHHCKKEGGVSSKPRIADQPTTEEEIREDKEERNRATIHKPARRQDWDAIDLSGQGMRSLSAPLFTSYGAFLKKLFLDHNHLRALDPRVGQARSLELLDISSNALQTIPEEIGMLVNLKSLLVYDNQLQDLPREIGHLFRLEILGIEGNQMLENQIDELAEHGTSALITQYRESINIDTLAPPHDRDWIHLDDSPASEQLSVVSYNILCDRYATTSQYGYTPSEALSWDYRKTLILEEINGYDADIVCLQEVDRESFDELFRRELALRDYRGVFWPKSRARTMAEKEAKLVDGCATFFKASKYHLLDKQLIDFANTAINRPDMKGEHNTFNRVMPRDHIAVACFLENRVTGSRLMVANTHIFWDPAFADVKLVQTAIMMEQLSKFADKWAKWPACTDKQAFRHSEVDGSDDPDTNDEPVELGPSLEYSSGPQIPLIICGDFNSAAGTGVYDLITNGSLPGNHADLANRGYGTFTRDGMAHPFKLKSAYNGTEELSFTNYVPHFSGVLDYIWYSTNALSVRGLLGNVDAEYLKKVPGFPNHHFPSDHLPLKAVFSVKPQKATRMDGENGVHKEWERRAERNAIPA